MGLRQLPNFRRTVWFVGDPHVGDSTSVGLSDVRKTKLLDDICRFPEPAAFVCLGDMTQQDASGANLPGADTRAVAFAQSFNPDAYKILGNHDAWWNSGSPSRTMEQARVALGIPSKHQTVDLGFARLVLLGPEDMTDDSTMRLAQAGLDYLAAAADASTVPVIACFHAPLKNTMISPQDPTQDSNAAGFYAVGPNGTDDTQIRATIAAHTQIKAWVSGHTHPELDYQANPLQGQWKAETIGGRAVACLNVPSPYYNGVAVEAYDQIWSCPLTVVSATQLECRWRNHTWRSWDSPGGATVQSIAVG